MKIKEWDINGDEEGMHTFMVLEPMHMGLVCHTRL